MSSAWDADLNEYHLRYLPLITSCLLVIMILSVFRDVILSNFNLPLWNIALNIGLIVILSAVALLSQLDKIPSERSQFIALVGMLCMGAKPIASMVLQSSPLPLYMAIVLFGSAIAFISYRYYYYIVGFTVIP
ncbi:MAG: hypothetical protein QGF90_20150, partial [Gammaproteobacteria bacterium]|nr:hypothetical protein [Gammaproteobacteria bacterium]